MPKRYILSIIYFARAIAILVYIMLPPSTVATLIFGRSARPALAVDGAADIRPRGVMFGTRWLAMLFGFAFFSHQVGGFLGVWLGGLLFERTGSYNAVWWLAILLGVLSAVSTCRSSRSRWRVRSPCRPERDDAGTRRRGQQETKPETGGSRPLPLPAGVRIPGARPRSSWSPAA